MRQSWEKLRKFGEITCIIMEQGSHKFRCYFRLNGAQQMAARKTTACPCGPPQRLFSVSLESKEPSLSVSRHTKRKGEGSVPGLGSARQFPRSIWSPWPRRTTTPVAWQRYVNAHTKREISSITNKVFPL